MEFNLFLLAMVCCYPVIYRSGFSTGFGVLAFRLSNHLGRVALVRSSNNNSLVSYGGREETSRRGSTFQRWAIDDDRLLKHEKNSPGRGGGVDRESKTRSA